MKITNEDKVIVSRMFPGLIFSGDYLQGNLNFSAIYLKDQGIYELLDYENELAEIKGEFSIKIKLSEPNPYREVYEVGGKIKNLAEKLDKKLTDLHAQKTKEENVVNVCVAGYLQEESDIGLVSFVCDIVVPYFCDLVVFENDGYWSRGEYSHGIRGLLESYSDELTSKNELELTKKFLLEAKVQEKDLRVIGDGLSLLRKFNRGRKISEKKISNRIGGRTFDGLCRLKGNIRKYELPIKNDLNRFFKIVWSDLLDNS